MKQIAMILLITATGLLGSCGDARDEGPREVVIALFGAMEREDPGTLLRMLDLPELMKQGNKDYALSGDGEPRIWRNPQDLIDDLLTGETKTRWFSFQRVIGAEEVQPGGEAAFVNVTFMDKSTQRAYLTKFGVHKVEGKWRIFSFQTESE